VVVAVFALLAVAVSVAAAFGGRSGAQPDAVKGATQFKSAGCGGCHTFAAAKSKGKTGPNLDAATLTLAQIQKQITNGGYGVMGLSAKKQYPFAMSAFKGKLPTSEIANIAAFVFVSRNPKAVPKGTTTTPSGGSTSGGSTTTTGGGSTTTTGGGSTTTGGGGGVANNGCPTGVTIQTSGNTDNDDDEGGGPTDNDGCV
jgi:cytochrome c553